MIGLIGTIFASLISNSYAINDSICGAYGLNAEQIHACIQAYLHYNKMNHDSSKIMQNNLDQNRQNNRQNQITQNVDVYHNYTITKPNIANSILYYDLSGKQWYENKIKLDKNEIILAIKNWKTYDHNPMPKPNCPAWHVCNHYNVSLNHTRITIPLKPQFESAPTGFINNTSSNRTR